MKYIKPENANMVFGAGKNPATGDLEVVMSYRDDIPGRAFSISIWEPSEEELAEINRTKKIYLSVMGVAMMPVCILGHDPFVHHGYYPALVVDQEVPGGMPVKKIYDPKGEMQFWKWMGMVEDEMKSRPFFVGRETNPTKYAPHESFRSMYENALMVEHCVDHLQKWIEHKTAQQN